MFKDWNVRLDKIWANEPTDIFDLAMADTIKVANPLFT
jgi:hypothetical protein